MTKRTSPHVQSMDAIDHAGYRAGPAPLDSRATTLALRPGAARHPEGAPALLLDGTWELAEAGEERARLAPGPWADAVPAQVPGSVHAALVAAGMLPDPTIGRNQPIVAQASYRIWWLKTTFDRPTGTCGERLVFDGVCNRCTVWLNGKRLGRHEGMFGGPEFAIAARLRDQNTLVVRLDPIPSACEGWSLKDSPRNTSWRQTVVFNNVYGWHYSQLPSLGIWRSVRIEGAPTVRLDHPFLATRDTVTGTMDLVVALQGDGTVAWSGTLAATIRPETFEGPARRFDLRVRRTAGRRVLHLRFRVPKPRLWWPVDLGEANLYRMTLSFTPDGGGQPDTQSFAFGIRTIAMAPLPGGPRPDKYNWTFVVNGKPVFVKGAGWCTLDPLMDFRRERYDRFLSLARDQHCQMLRAWGAGMPETDDFYDLCDRYGILVMQEWPTAGNSHETQPFGLLKETVRRNMLRLRNRASLAIYTGGNESSRPFGRTIDMMGRLSIELDGTRAFHRTEPWGGSRHDYSSYWGRQSLDAHLRQEADFYGEFGMACMPVYESVQRYLPEDEKTQWPPPPDGAFAFHTPVFNTAMCLLRLTQFAQYFVPKDSTMQAFGMGTQLAQAVCLRHQLERARSRWPHCTGAIYYKLNDNFPAASWSTVDWYGAPKLGHSFVQDALAPLHALVRFDSVHQHAVHFYSPVYLLDDAGALDRANWRVVVRAYDARLHEVRRLAFDGQGAIASPLQVGSLDLTFQQTDTAPLLVVAEVFRNDALADRTFYFVNYEFDNGCLFRLPRTTLTLDVRAGVATVRNAGTLPAVGVHIDRPGHLDSFTPSDNDFWLDAGESLAVRVSNSDDLTVAAWNADDCGGQATPGA
jgi:beta-mannosidase